MFSIRYYVLYLIFQYNFFITQLFKNKKKCCTNLVTETASDGSSSDACGADRVSANYPQDNLIKKHVTLRKSKDILILSCHRREKKNKNGKIFSFLHQHSSQVFSNTQINFTPGSPEPVPTLQIHCKFSFGASKSWIVEHQFHKKTMHGSLVIRGF